MNWRHFLFSRRIDWWRAAAIAGMLAVLSWVAAHEWARRQIEASAPARWRPREMDEEQLERFHQILEEQTRDSLPTSQARPPGIHPD